MITLLTNSAPSGAICQPMKMKDNSKLIDHYMDKTYWVIDLLPNKVPANGCGQYFKIEDYFLGAKFQDLCVKFANILLKFNCYHDFEVCRCDLDLWDSNPDPEDLVCWVKDGEPLCVVLKDADAMISINGDDTHMTLYNPNDELLELSRTLATSEGLFVWEPK